MAVKRTPLTQEQFDLLACREDWHIDEVPRQHWPKIPGLERLDDTVAIMASGNVPNPGVLQGIHAVAGLDLLALESHPKPGEPSGNAYHYVFQKTTRSDYPFIMHGPFKHDAECVVPHWFEAPDLERYWSE